ncbi:MAG: restriction endonuclease subunit S [Anaerolineales bacterium]|nr:restriction endonuclease subunit S [Anaerolineales bacterium]
MTKLGSKIKIYKGRKAPNVFEKRQPGAFRYIQIDDLRPDAEIKYAIDPDGVKASANDVLIAWDGANAGTVGFDLDGYIGSTIAILRPVGKDIFAPYLGYFLKSKFDYLQKNCTGATIPHISRRSIDELEIPLFPLTEQKRIAAILDKADRIRRLRRFALGMSDGYLQSVFLEMFGDPVTNPMGWEKQKISKLSSVKTGGTPSRKELEFYNGSIPWVKTTEVVGSIILQTEERITEQGLKASNCDVFPIGTILIAMYGQGLTRGRTAKLGIPATTNQACAAILPTDHVNMDYFWAYLKLSYKQLRDLGRGGNQPNLNLSMVKDFEVLLPLKELQLAYARIIRHYERLQSQQHESLRQAEHLFQSLLARAFEGEL